MTDAQDEMPTDAPVGLTFKQLLAELQTRHVEIAVHKDEVRYKPKEALDKALIMEVARYRYELMERNHWTSDPRPDLATDHHLWTKVLRAAHDHYGDATDGVLGVLHGFRCYGARLKFERGHLHLGPRYDATAKEAGWRNEEEWQEDRDRYLVPQTKGLKELFTFVAKMEMVGAG